MEGIGLTDQGLCEWEGEPMSWFEALFSEDK